MQQEPNSAKFLRYKRNVKKTQRRGRLVVLETGAVKTDLSRKPTRLSHRFQKTSG